MEAPCSAPSLAEPSLPPGIMLARVNAASTREAGNVNELMNNDTQPPRRRTLAACCVILRHGQRRPAIPRRRAGTAIRHPSGPPHQRRLKPEPYGSLDVRMRNRGSPLEPCLPRRIDRSTRYGAACYHQNNRGACREKRPRPCTTRPAPGNGSEGRSVPLSAMFALDGRPVGAFLRFNRRRSRKQRHQPRQDRRNGFHGQPGSHQPPRESAIGPFSSSSAIPPR